MVAYLDCRRTKRNTAAALAFEQDLEANLCQLYESLLDGSYKPGRSVCFVISWPKVREVWAAPFPDRVVHHLLHNRIAPRFYASFIADSCACIVGRGTMYAAERLGEDPERHAELEAPGFLPEMRHPELLRLDR